MAACYGYKFAADYVTKIKKFSCEYLDLGINATPKFHAVMHHVQAFCAFTGRRFGAWTEQASESIHHDLKQTWHRFHGVLSYKRIVLYG